MGEYTRIAIRAKISPYKTRKAIRHINTLDNDFKHPRKPDILSFYNGGGGYKKIPYRNGQQAKR